MRLNNNESGHNVLYHRRAFGKVAVTFILELYPYWLEIYRMCKYELPIPTLKLSKVIVWQIGKQTDRQTDIHVHDRNYIPRRLDGGQQLLFPLRITLSLDSFSRWNSWTYSSWPPSFMSSDLIQIPAHHHLNHHFHRPSLLLSSTPGSKLISCINSSHRSLSLLPFYLPA